MSLKSRTYYTLPKAYDYYSLCWFPPGKQEQHQRPGNNDKKKKKKSDDKYNNNNSSTNARKRGVKESKEGSKRGKTEASKKKASPYGTKLWMRPVATTWEREWARALHGITDYRPPPPARLSSLARTAGVFF